MKAELRSPKAGRVVKVFPIIGSLVQADQHLVVIDDQQEQAMLVELVAMQAKMEAKKSAFSTKRFSDRLQYLKTVSDLRMQALQQARIEYEVASSAIPNPATDDVARAFDFEVEVAAHRAMIRARTDASRAAVEVDQLQEAARAATQHLTEIIRLITTERELINGRLAKLTVVAPWAGPVEILVVEGVAISRGHLLATVR